MRWLIVALGTLVLAAGSGPVVEAADRPGPYHKNEAWGFKVRAPAKWNIVHMDSNEQWIALKAIGPRDLYGDRGEGWGERPEMWVIAFPHERQRQRGAKREKIDDTTTLITVQNPYKDYRDFVKREKRLALGESEVGFFFSVEDQTEHADMHVDLFEVKAEKMVEVPKHLTAWVYHTEDVDYAVQFKILEHHYEDYQSTFLTCLKSFRLIPRTQPMPGSSSTGKKIIDIESEKDLTPEERKKRRVERVEKYLRDEIANLPRDWTHKDSKHFCVISHADDKFTRRVSEHAENVREYLKETFPDLGDDYVPRGIIRIFQDNAEENAFRQGTRDMWLDDVDQILIAGDKNWSLRWEYERVGREVTRQWLYYKNKNLYENLPWWLREGLLEHMEKARPSKRKGLVFAPDAHDVQQLVRLVKGEKAVPLKDVFLGKQGTGGIKIDDIEGLDPFNFISPSTQASSVFHWLLTKGNRRPVKGALQTYMSTLVHVIAEEDAKFEAEEAERHRKRMQEAARRAEENGGERLEEEDEGDDDWKEAWKEYAARLKEKADAIAERAFGAAFGHLSEKDWAKLDKKWQAYAEKGGR
jgi:hypothetical protein